MNQAAGTKKKIKGDLLNMFILIILLVGEIVIFSLRSEYFLTLKNVFNIGLNIAVLGIVSIGQTLCILTSDFDLSVGGAAAFCGIMVGFFFEQMGMNYVAAFILAVGVGCLIGLVNGLLITKMKISAFITTMATNYMLGGMVLLVSQGKAILVSGKKSFTFLGQTTFGNIRIPLPMIIFIVLYFIFAWILKNTVFGRHIYCVGGNAESAKIAGINNHRVKILTFVLSGALSGFAGIILASRMSACQITVGSTYGMESIAATVLGGTILAGGKGNMLGTFIGVLVTGIMSNGLTMLGFSQAWRDIATGLLLIFAIIVQNLIKQSDR